MNRGIGMFYDNVNFHQSNIVGCHISYSILDRDGIGLWMKDCPRSWVSDCMIRDDRVEKKATLSLKVEGGKENCIKGSVFANGVEAAKDAAVLEGNR